MYSVGASSTYSVGAFIPCNHPPTLPHPAEWSYKVSSAVLSRYSVVVVSCCSCITINLGIDYSALDLYLLKSSSQTASRFEYFHFTRSIYRQTPNCYHFDVRLDETTLFILGGISISCTGLLDWTTGLDYLTGIFLVFSHSVVKLY